MHFEDFISGEPLEKGSVSALLPKKHTIAICISIAVVALAAISVSIPADASNDSGLVAINDSDSSDELILIDPDATDNIIRPESSLTEALFPNIANTKVKTYAVGKQIVEIDSDPITLDSMDDELADEVIDEDNSIENQVRKLAKAEGTALTPNHWYTETVTKGDTISSIFSDLNIPARTLVAIRKTDGLPKSFDNLQIGDNLSFLIDDDNNLLSFVKQENKKADEEPVLALHPTVRWENTLDIKATKYLTTSIYFQLYYNRAQCYDVQTQTILSVGLSYTFQNKPKPK